MSNRKIGFSCVLICMAMNVSAQQPVAYLTTETGTITGNDPAAIYKSIDAARALPSGRAASLKKCLATQLGAIYTDRVMNPPRGFAARTVFYLVKDPVGGTPGFPACVLTTGMYYLVRDPRTGAAKVSMDGTAIGLETNNLHHFLGQVGNFWKECDEVKVPEFFEELPVTDSSADYIQLDFSKYNYPHITPGKPFRIVRGNGRPIFVPLKRKAFLKFLIAQKISEMKACQDNIKDDEKIVVEQGNLYNNPAMSTSRQLIATTIEKEKQYIVDENKKLAQLRLVTADYQKVLGGMTPRERDAPVRLDYKRYLSADPLDGLLAEGSTEGTALFTVNPDYYDKSEGAPAAQLIVVYYELPSVTIFGPDRLNYLQQATTDLFHRLDYHTLRMSMR